MCDLLEKNNLNNYLKYCFITRQKRDIFKLLDLIEKIKTKYFEEYDRGRGKNKTKNIALKKLKNNIICKK